MSRANRLMRRRCKSRSPGCCSRCAEYPADSGYLPRSNAPCAKTCARPSCILPCTRRIARTRRDALIELTRTSRPLPRQELSQASRSACLGYRRFTGRATCTRFLRAGMRASAASSTDVLFADASSDQQKSSFGDFLPIKKTRGLLSSRAQTEALPPPETAPPPSVADSARNLPTPLKRRSNCRRHSGGEQRSDAANGRSMRIRASSRRFTTRPARPSSA